MASATLAAVLDVAPAPQIARAGERGELEREAEGEVHHQVATCRNPSDSPPSTSSDTPVMKLA